MNYEQANSVKELAAPVNKVLERLEWECSECDGGKMMAEHPGCQSCKGTFKVKYSWTPRVGERVCFPSPCCWMPLVIDVKNDYIGVLDGGKLIWLEIKYNELIPILEWETIEELLDKVGYIVDVSPVGDEFTCEIHRKGVSFFTAKSLEKSRQEAVYQAVIELGKEIK